MSFLPATVPLGSAAFHEGGGPLRRHQPGDFLLGYQQDGQPVGLRDDRHVFVTSMPRSGKGTSVLIPNLLMWPGSAVVIDPKGENAMVTARRRARGSLYCRGLKQRIKILDPFDVVRRDGDDFADLKGGYNPLDAILTSPEHAIRIAGRITDAIVVSEQAPDPYWDNSARTLLRGLILHVASSIDFLPDQRNLLTVRALAMSGDQEALAIALKSSRKNPPSSYALLARSMQRNKAFGGAVAEVGNMLADLDRSEKTRVGVVQNLRTHLDFMMDEGMARCLSHSSFRLSDLKLHPLHLSLYLCLPQVEMPTHHRWLRMMTTLVIGEMESIRQQPIGGHPVLMLLDEFPALGRMRVLENAAAQIAGFGVKMVFVAQTLAQLKDTYKDNWETLLASAGAKIFFGNEDLFTREYVSKLIGEREVVRTVANRSQTSGTSSSNTEGRSNGISTGYTDSHSSGHSSGSSYGQSGGSYNSGSSYNASSSVSQTISNSWNRSETYGQNRSQTSGESETVHRRPLLSPDEVGRLFGNRERPAMLALVPGCQPIVLQRILYHKTSWLRGTYDPHPDHSTPLTLVELEAERLADERKAKERTALAAKLAEAERLRLLACEEANRRFWERDAMETAKRRRHRELKALTVSVIAAVIVMWSAWPVFVALGISAIPIVMPRKQPERSARPSITGYYSRDDDEPSRSELFARFAAIAMLGGCVHFVNTTPAAKTLIETQRLAMVRYVSSTKAICSVNGAVLAAIGLKRNCQSRTS